MRLSSLKRDPEKLRRQRLGQFFTPPPVADFAMRMLAALGAIDAEGPPLRVVDPAAGDGVFLRAAGRAFAHRRPTGLGLDLDHALSEMGSAQVVCAHGLLDHPELGVAPDGFDLAVGNPPYGGDGLGDLAALADGAAPSAEAWRVARAVLLESELLRRFPARPRPVEADDLDACRLTVPLAASLRRASRFPIEVLFVERFVGLVRPGGWVAAVLPEGLLSNARWAFVRDWLRERGRVAAVVGLPRVFSQAGASARTALLFFQKAGAPARGGADVLMADVEAEWMRPIANLSDLAGEPASAAAGPHRRPRACDTEAYFQRVVDADAGAATRVPWPALRGQRWDPQFWDPRYAHPLRGLEQRRLARFGDFIAHLTYGPIVTRRFPRELPGPVPVVSQGQFEASGVSLAFADRVAVGCVFDPERSRAGPGDLLFPRSGMGSLGRNRLAVYDGPEPVNLGCFVNLIRLRGLNPYYAWLFLKTRFGWGQIRRIIHGVGMPNISFDEIRALQVAWVGEAEQAAVERMFRREVAPAHAALVAAASRRGDPRAAPAVDEVQARNAATAALRRAVARLELNLETGLPIPDP